MYPPPSRSWNAPHLSPVPAAGVCLPLSMDNYPFLDTDNCIHSCESGYINSQLRIPQFPSHSSQGKIKSTGYSRSPLPLQVVLACCCFYNKALRQGIWNTEMTSLVVLEVPRSKCQHLHCLIRLDCYFQDWTVNTVSSGGGKHWSLAQ